MNNNLALKWFYKLKKDTNPEIKKIVELIKKPSFIIPKWENIDDAVIFIVINQMLSIKASQKICNNLYTEFNNSKNILDFCCKTYNEKGALFSISQSKRKTLKNWYNFKSTFYHLSLLNNNQKKIFLEELKKQKGFGQWSIDMLAIFYFGLPDIWPSGDMNIKKVSKIIFGSDKINDIKDIIINNETIIALCFWEIYDKKLI